MAWEVFEYGRRHTKEFVSVSSSGALSISAACGRKNRLGRFTAARVTYNKETQTIEFEFLVEKLPKTCPLRWQDTTLVVVCGVFTREIGIKPGRYSAIWDEDLQALAFSYAVEVAAKAPEGTVQVLESTADAA